MRIKNKASFKMTYLQQEDITYDELNKNIKDKLDAIVDIYNVQAVIISTVELLEVK